MQFFNLKFFTLSILCSLVIYNTHAQEFYNVQQRAEEITRKFMWPDGKIPKTTVTFSDEADIGSCVWYTGISHSFDIYLRKEKFSTYTDKAKDFILAHEIAHYYLFKVGYLPELILTVHSYLMQYLLCSSLTIYDIFGFILGLCIKYSILITRLFLQRLIEYEADKQAVLILQDKTSIFDIPSRKITALGKLLEIIGFLFRVHPYDGQRKQALEELTID